MNAILKKKKLRLSVFRDQHLRTHGYLRRVVFEPLEPRELLAPLANVGTASDMIFNLPASGSTVVFEDDGIAGNGISQLRSTNGTFDTTTFANPAGSLSINAGNAADSIAINALPDFTAGLTTGLPANPIGSITFAGPVSLAADQNLTAYASGTINLSNSASKLTTAGNGAILLATARNVLVSSGSSITSVNGGITLSANQQSTPTSGSFTGVSVDNATVHATGSGPVTVLGKGGDGTSPQKGVQITAGGKVQSSAGPAVVQGSGGNSSGDSNYGVWITGDGSEVSSAANGVHVTGSGGGSGGAGFGYGVLISFSGKVSAGGVGNVAVVGTGGVGSGTANHGVKVANVGSTIFSRGGNVLVTGQGGGTGAAGLSVGVFLQLGASVNAGDAGAITIQGAGGAGSGDTNYGVWIFDAGSSIMSSGGNVLVTGIEGAGNSGAAIVNGGGSISTGLNGGTLTVVGNTMSIASAATISAGSSGTVTLKPFTSGVGINLGQATDPIGGPLGLTDAELARITAGTLQIGDASSGPISISATLTLAGRNLALVTGAGVTGNGTIVNGSATAATVTFDQAGDSTYSGRMGGGTANNSNLAFTKLGMGTLTITNSSNAYTGDTTIGQGILKVVSSDIIPSGPGKGNVVFNPSSGTATLELASTIGRTIYFNGLSSSGSGTSIIDNTLGQNTLWVGLNDQTTSFGGIIRNTDGMLRLSKTGTGTLTLTGSITTARIDVAFGTLLVNGTATGEIWVNFAYGATFGGSGTVGPIRSSLWNHLAPGAVRPGVLNSGNVVLGAGSFDVDIEGPTLGSQYDQLNVTGTVSLKGSPLNVTLRYSPTVGEQFTIINNDSTDDPIDSLYTLAEGRVFTVGSGNYRGMFKITYRGGDGNDVVLTSVNTAPAFQVGPDMSVVDEADPQIVEGWATAISPGLPGEAGQQFQFVVTENTNPGLFAKLPAIDAAGNLTFTPAPNAEGAAQITVVLVDDGGTANGGIDTSAPQTFTIDVTKGHLWYNTALPADVTGDQELSPEDALAVINFLNSSGAGPVPQTATSGPPFYDVNQDNFVAPIDALLVINHLNALSQAKAGAPPAENEAGGKIAAANSVVPHTSEPDWLAQVATDVATYVKRRRRN